MGDCHYLDGNVKAEKMFDTTRQLAVVVGIDERRLRLEWISSAEGTRFAEVATEFTETIRGLGPSELAQKSA